MSIPVGKVLIIEENSWVPIDRRVWYEATTLRDAGWQVVVICPDAKSSHAGRGADRQRGPKEETLEGIKIYRFPLVFAETGITNYIQEYLVAFICIAWLSWKVWRKHGFDILHVCNPPDIFFPLGLFYRLLGASFVFDHHDLFPEMLIWRYPRLSGRVMYIFARLAEYLTFRCANAVIATNESYRQIAMERGDVPGSRVIAVRNGPKISVFVPVEPLPALKREFSFMVCFVGIMGVEDGVLEMLDVIRHIIRDLGRRDILFALIGDGAIRLRVMTDIAADGLEPYVDMPGMIRDDVTLRQYMSTADVFVSPEPLTPLNTRSTFIKIGEYMAMGKPIVAFDLCETRYTAQDAACYVTPGDIRGFAHAIVQLLDEPERRHHIGTKGRQRMVGELGWEYQSPQLLRAYALARQSAHR
jgi:glycosyltransferase involved in cell wall biosynthesis